MSQLTKADLTTATAIIAKSFDANPSVNITIGKGGNRKKKLIRLAEYVYIKAYKRDGAYLSENKMGVALFYLSDKKVVSLKEVFYELRFAFSLSPKKVLNSLKRERYLKNHRPNEVHLFFWFLGVIKGGDRAGFELKKIAFENAQKHQVPILLETSVERNVIVYQKFGFYTYHIWEDTPNETTLWFMRKDPN